MTIVSNVQLREIETIDNVKVYEVSTEDEVITLTSDEIENLIRLYDEVKR